MQESVWYGLSDARFKKKSTLLTLVESFADESLSPKRMQIPSRRVYDPLRRHKRHDPQLRCPLQKGGAVAKDGEKKTYLFMWVDDYSRKILSGLYYFDEKLPPHGRYLVSVWCCAGGFL